MHSHSQFLRLIFLLLKKENYNIYVLLLITTIFHFQMILHIPT